MNTALCYLDVDRVYSGRSGCQCGCQGTYRDSPGSRKNMLTRILKQPDIQVDIWQPGHHSELSGCIHRDDGHRSQVVYILESARDKLELLAKLVQTNT